MKTLHYAALVGLLAVALVGWRYVAATSQTDQVRATVTPYALDADGMSKLERSALAGDCAAAYRLGKHHMSYSLDHAAAVRWLRVAAKCPDADAKEGLVLLLRESPEYAGEVDRLVREITQIDPARGKRTAEAVQVSKQSK